MTTKPRGEVKALGVGPLKKELFFRIPELVSYYIILGNLAAAILDQSSKLLTIILIDLNFWKKIGSKQKL